MAEALDPHRTAEQQPLSSPNAERSQPSTFDCCLSIYSAYRPERTGAREIRSKFQDEDFAMNDRFPGRLSKAGETRSGIWATLEYRVRLIVRNW